jgi:hypothetical protein
VWRPFRPWNVKDDPARYTDLRDEEQFDVSAEDARPGLGRVAVSTEIGSRIGYPCIELAAYGRP